jgi:hypothetical protein
MTTTNNKVCDKQHNNEKSTKKKLPKNDHLINSAVAAITFQENLKRKLSIKKNYYKHKIKILREIRDL